MLPSHPPSWQVRGRRPAGSGLGAGCGASGGLPLRHPRPRHRRELAGVLVGSRVGMPACWDGLLVQGSGWSGWAGHPAPEARHALAACCVVACLLLAVWNSAFHLPVKLLANHPTSAAHPLAAAVQRAGPPAARLHERNRVREPDADQGQALCAGARRPDWGGRSGRSELCRRLLSGGARPRLWVG